MDYEITEQDVLYNDWFLPSKGEPFEIYENIDLLSEFNLILQICTSTEADQNAGAWRQNIFTSAQNVSKKYKPFSVRPVKIF